MWAMLKKGPSTGSQQQYDVIQEECSSISSSKSTKKNKAPPHRTAMGEYIVPEDGKPLTSLGDAKPGPSDYLPKIDLIKASAPHFSIVGKPKIRNGKRNIPGPFEYNCSDSINWKSKTITLTGRGKSYFDVKAEKSTTLIGKYKPEYKTFGSEGPKFKIGKKLPNHNGLVNSLVHPVDTKGFKTPGPNYRPNSSYWGRGHKKSFGEKSKNRPGENPGPGDYDVKTEKQGPSFSFGVKLPERLSTQSRDNKFSPAANTYDIGTTIGKAPSISIAGRLTLDKEAPTNPGPADYMVHHVNLKNNPSFSCGRRVKASYPDSVTTCSNKAVNDTPGPGAYNLVKAFVANDKPAFSLRKRLDPEVDKERFPGPNSYQAEKRDKPGSKQAPAFSMAKRLIPPNSMKDYPGPSQYTPKMQKTDKAVWTMTKRPKGKEGSFVNPAPNLYTLPEVISNKNNGVGFKSRASPYVYSGYRTSKLFEPQGSSLPPLPAISA